MTGARPSFNLLDEPWIPVITGDGAFEEVGLLGLFGLADRLRAIWSDNALETLALHRLAIAVTLAALTSPDSFGGPRWDLSVRAIDQIDEGGLPAERIVDYLEQWRDRFWLFGPEAFWQLGAKDDSPVARLDPLRAVGSQPAFFDHYAAASSVVCSVAARMLLVGQVFAVGAGHGPGGRAFRNGLVGKLGLIALPLGDSVGATLQANLVAYEAERQPKDAPVWERDRPVRSGRIDSAEHVPDGLLDMLTWEPRAVELRLTSDGRVAHAGFAMGVNGASFAQLVDRRRIDPWVPLQLTAGGALQRLRGRAGPAAWRDSLAVLLGVLPRPELAEARSVLSARRSRFGGQRALALLVGGLIAEGQNTLAGSLLARLPLPPEALDELPAPFLAGLEQLVSDGRGAARAAVRALAGFAREYYATDRRRAARLGREAWEREESAYWATGGRVFSAHVARLAGGEDFHAVRVGWLQVVRGAAATAVQRGTEPFTDAAGLRAGALAAAQLRRDLPARRGGSEGVTVDDRRAQAVGFASRLWSTLERDRGASVELRQLLAPAPVPTRAYWQLGPPDRIWPRELPMWLAGLAASRPRSIARPQADPERPGQTLRRARDRIAQEGRGSVKAFERQIGELLTCHPDDLRRELVPVIELALRVGVQFDYGLLLLDLSGWGDPARYVQRRWAEDLWAPATRSNAAAEMSPKEETET